MIPSTLSTTDSPAQRDALYQAGLREIYQHRGLPYQVLMANGNRMTINRWLRDSDGPDTCNGFLMAPAAPAPPTEAR